METTTSSEQNLTIAKTILDQMGGTRRLMLMIGAKDFLAIPNGVTFRFAARSANSSNAFKVVLDADDTYTIEFLWIRAGKVTVRKELNMVYGSDLQRIFRDETKLALSL